MRYWHPDTSEAIAALDREPYDELVLLPALSALFLRHHPQQPQRMESPIPAAHARQSALTISTIIPITSPPSSNASTASSPPSIIPTTSISSSAPTACRWLWSKRAILTRKQIEETVQLVRELGSWENPYVLCYQSKVGPQKWLQPSLTATIERMAKSGITRMLVIPIAFLTDHIETLHEINIEAREQAESLGVTEFHMMPALNDSPLLDPRAR